MSHLLILAAETAGDDALAEMEAIAGRLSGVGPGAGASGRDPARHRCRPMLEAVAVALPESSRGIEVYQALADPMTAQPSVRDVVRQATAPPLSDAAIAPRQNRSPVAGGPGVPLPACRHAFISSMACAVHAADVLAMRRCRGGRLAAGRIRRCSA